MYGLPLEFDQKIFIGRFLSSINFSLGSISINFDLAANPGASTTLLVSITGTYLMNIGGKLSTGEGEKPVSGVPLLSLLNRNIVFAEKIGKGDLCLEFDSGDKVRLVEDDSGFECYTIYVPGEEPYVI